MGTFNLSELQTVNPNDYEKSLGMMGLRKVIHSLEESVDDLVDATTKNARSFVDQARERGGYGYPDRMDVTLEQESMYGLIHMMRNSLFKVAIMNAIGDIVQPLADRIELFHLEDRIEAIREHREGQLARRRIIDAIVSASEKNSQSMITALMRQYRNFMSNPVLNTIQLFVTKIATPIFNMARSILFGSRKGMSDADRIVKAVNQVREFMMTGQVDNTKLFAQRLFESGVVGLPLKMIGESVASLVGISRKNAQAREDAFVAGSSAKDQGFLRNPKGFISDYIFGDEIVRKAKSGGIVETVEGGAKDPSIKIFESILEKLVNISMKSHDHHMELKRIGDLIEDPTAPKSSIKFDRSVIQMMKNEKGVFESIEEILVESHKLSQQQLKVENKQLAMDKKQYRHQVLSTIMGTLTRLSTGITGLLGGAGAGLLGGAIGAGAGALAAKLGLLFNPVTGAIALATASAIALYQVLPDEYQQKIDETFVILKDHAVRGVGMWLDSMGLFYDTVTTTFTSIKDRMVEVWNSTVGKVVDFFGNASNVVENKVDAVSRFVGNRIDDVKSLFVDRPSPQVNVNFKPPADVDPIGETLRQIVNDPTRGVNGDAKQHELTRELIEVLKEQNRGKMKSPQTPNRAINSDGVFNSSPLDLEVYSG